MKRLSTFLFAITLGLSAYDVQAQNSDFLMDARDGNIYLVARFNNLWWMCQNLKFDAGSGASCYNDDETNCMLQGRLYDWASAQGACPEGYRLASDKDWQSMESYLGMDDEDLEKRYNRESGTIGKYLKPGGGLSFDAEYVGMINPKGNSSYTGIRAFFWTSTEMDENMAWIRLIDKARDGVERQPMAKTHKFSVRCVRDATPEEMQIQDTPELSTEDAKPTEENAVVEPPPAEQAPAERQQGERRQGERPQGERKKGERPKGQKPKGNKSGGGG